MICRIFKIIWSLILNENKKSIFVIFYIIFPNLLFSYKCVKIIDSWIFKFLIETCFHDYIFLLKKQCFSLKKNIFVEIKKKCVSKKIKFLIKNIIFILFLIQIIIVFFWNCFLLLLLFIQWTMLLIYI
jgi:hypothetical protein